MSKADAVRLVGDAVQALSNPAGALLAGYERLIERLMPSMEPYLIAAVFDNMGLTIDPVKGFTNEGITAAINAGPMAGTGIQFGNVFDRDSLRAGLEKVAISRACAAFGLSHATSVGALRESLRVYVAGEVKAQLASEYGSMIEGAEGLPEILEAIGEGAKQDGWNTPTVMTKAGISNRARQARYRAGHKRQWQKS